MLYECPICGKKFTIKNNEYKLEGRAGVYLCSYSCMVYFEKIYDKNYRIPSKENIARMRDLRKQGLTYRDIAGHCGYSISTAFRYCNDVTTKRKQHMKPNTCDIEKMCHLRSKRYQVQQIAETMGFSKATVSKYTSHLKIGKVNKGRDA